MRFKLLTFIGGLICLIGINVCKKYKIVTLTKVHATSLLGTLIQTVSITKSRRTTRQILC